MWVKYGVIKGGLVCGDGDYFEFFEGDVYVKGGLFKEV